tara:strand:- start:292 stop:888 length:597 start_codon:yes stop_codon:yes gene_type:complete
MALVLNGSANTIGGLAVGGLPDGSVDTDTLADGAITAAKKGSGSVLQVVSKQDNTHSEKTNTSFEDIPGMSLAITPTAASNKILIQATLCISKYNNHSFLGRMLRDTTVLPGGNGDQANHVDNIWWNVRSTEYSSDAHTVIYLDTIPSDWSSGAITYKIQGLTTHSSYEYGINQTTYDSNHAIDSPAASSITLTEIKA